VQTPVYYPFFHAIEKNGRRLVRNPLVADGGTFRMDLADLERKLDDRTRMLILCSPHNPVGRVWTRPELEALGRSAFRRDVVVLSDEIHMDLTLPGHTHVPLATVSPALAERTVTCVAPSKTFNLAGLSMSLSWPQPGPAGALRGAVRCGGTGDRQPVRHGGAGGGVSERGRVARAAARVPRGERGLRRAFHAGTDPRAAIHPAEGTYLALIDCAGSGCRRRSRRVLPQDGARLLRQRPVVREEATGCERINLACPRATLAEALERIERAINKRLAAGSR